MGRTTLGVTGLILAGGQSRRMGRDKAHLPWGSGTLIEHVVETLRPIVDEMIVAVKHTGKFRGLDARVVEDLVPDAHALGGLYTGLRVASHARCFVCACDAPCVNRRLIRFLLQQAEGWDLVIPRTREGLQPLHAVYAKSALPAMKEQLRHQRWNLQLLIPRLRTKVIGSEVIARFDREGSSFINVNTPEDYKKAYQSSPMGS